MKAIRSTEGPRRVPAPQTLVGRLADAPQIESRDLVTLSEAARELGVLPVTLRARWRRGLAPSVHTRYRMPEPKVLGRSVRLWDMDELAEWWRSLDTP